VAEPRDGSGGGSGDGGGAQVRRLAFLHIQAFLRRLASPLHALESLSAPLASEQHTLEWELAVAAEPWAAPVVVLLVLVLWVMAGEGCGGGGGDEGRPWAAPLVVLVV